MDAALARLGDEYVEAHYRARPFAATGFGISGYDALVPDPSREADAALRARLAELAGSLAQVDPAPLGATERVSHAMLTRILRDEQATLRHDLTEVAVSATMMGAFARLIGVVPAASVADPARAEAYLARLRQLAGYLDALGRRQLLAAGEGRLPIARAVQQAVAQLDGYLATPLSQDPLLRPTPGPGVDQQQWRAAAAELVGQHFRPAVARYRATLAEHLLPVGRPDEQAGACHMPGGAEGYLAQVRAHTTTELTPAEIHETGRQLVAELRAEFAERGGRALGAGDASEVLTRLRDDPTLRFEHADEIVDTVTGALRRAEAALPQWFPSYHIAPCVVRPMDPVEAENSVLGYYRPPAADGSRPGAHVVNTHQPQLRPRFEYEALAFHESVPGHHLQLAVAQTLTDLPRFRRFGHTTAYVEGWALYTERLCDEMGLYSDELSRLGMVSFDAWRACRLVVDTGLHHYGWSRGEAIDYLRDNTALSESNIANEVDRYLASPGQALAYMIGRLRIDELRARAQAEQGASFDLRSFHGQLLDQGPVPLDILG